ncbi:hypothetical protein [Sphaerisporangium rhizosphaerae]|uniref:YHYH domain-containing protein n=1 Tax=Sphaerisporangium rhizosphaerae TaxID=2269375 RepID=A0ABW2NWT4_9ACTN
MLKTALAAASLAAFGLAIPAAALARSGGPDAMTAAAGSPAHPCPQAPYGRYANGCYYGQPQGVHHWHHGGHHHWHHGHPYGHHHRHPGHPYPSGPGYTPRG